MHFSVLTFFRILNHTNPYKVLTGLLIMEKDIGKILKGEYQGNVTEIVIAVKEYNSRVGVDIREYSTSEQYTGPTKKGLRIPAEKFEEFKTMINSIDPNDLKAAPVATTQADIPTQVDDNEDDAGVAEDGTM
jgi:hypothetical protein